MANLRKREGNKEKGTKRKVKDWQTLRCNETEVIESMKKEKEIKRKKDLVKERKKRVVERDREGKRWKYVRKKDLVSKKEI